MILAMECVEETAPRFGVEAGFDEWDGTPICALGHVYARAFGPKAIGAYSRSICTDEEKVVLLSNDDSLSEERHAALVFPLLALADALDDATEGSP